MDTNLHSIGHIETPYNKLQDCPMNIETNGLDCLNGTTLIDVKFAIKN